MFTLGPIIQEAPVCLRCQYRLSIRKASRRTTPQRSITTPQQLQRFAPSRNLGQELSIGSDGARADRDIVAPVDEDDEPVARHRLEGTFFPRTASANAGVKHFRRVQKNILSFNALGEPAEVLVLNNREMANTNCSNTIELRSKRPAKVLGADAPSPSKLLDEIDGERGLVDADQVFDNIENVRKTWAAKSKKGSRIFSVADFAQLSTQLAKGFTVKQLAAYLNRKDADESKDPLDLQYEFSSIFYTRSTWTPGTTSLEQSRAPNLVEPGEDDEKKQNLIYERVNRRLLQKSTLIKKIFRQCWQFQVRQDESAEGELDLRLQATHLDLLIHHKRGILKQISETYGAKIEASQQNRVMRITSDYDTCLDILKVIISTLGNIRTFRIDLQVPFKSQPNSGIYTEPDDALLRQVEQLTDTVIKTKLTKEGFKQLHVYYFGPDDGDLQDVRKLISQFMRPKPANTGWLVWCGTVNLSETVPAPVDVSSGLPLIHRSRQWSRWCSPRTRRVDSKRSKSGVNISLNALASPLNDNPKTAKSLKEFFAPPKRQHELTPEESPYWQSNIAYSDLATLGQVVFPTATADQDVASTKAKTKDVSNGLRVEELEKSHREFVSSVPGVFRLLERLGSMTSKSKVVEHLQIRLSPSFMNASLPFPVEMLPDVEIRISLDNDDRRTSIQHTRLVYSKQLDVLLPQYTVDIRFIRNSFIYWRTEGPCAHSIRQFVQDSNLDLWGTGRLRTPTELTLEVPWHALRPHTALKNCAKPESILAEYTFSSLEHHSELRIPTCRSGPWSNLTYASIEAGRVGGRRDELTLEYPNGVGQETILFSNDESPHSLAETAVPYEPNPGSLVAKTKALIDSLEGRPDHVGYASEAFSEPP